MIVFDLETTGLDVKKDRIVQYCFMNEKKSISSLIYPEMKIPKSATDVHKISDKDVELCQPFKDHAESIVDFIMSEKVIAGFNIINFDLPLLANEMMRCGFKDFAMMIFVALTEPEKSELIIIDGSSIFRNFFKRTLTGAAEYYLDVDFTDSAHDAVRDGEITMQVIQAQMEKYNIDTNKAFEISLMPPEGFLDRACKIKSDGKFTFGKYAGKHVSEADIGYLQWIVNGDFDFQTKHVIKKLGNLK